MIPKLCCERVHKRKRQRGEEKKDEVGQCRNVDFFAIVHRFFIYSLDPSVQLRSPTFAAQLRTDRLIIVDLDEVGRADLQFRSRFSVLPSCSVRCSDARLGGVPSYALYSSGIIGSKRADTDVTRWYVCTRRGFVVSAGCHGHFRNGTFAPDWVCPGASRAIGMQKRASDRKRFSCHLFDLF